MTTKLIVSVVGPEQSGFMNQLTVKTRALGGTWLASKLTHLDGQMAGLLKLEIAEDKVEDFKLMMNEFNLVTTNYNSVSENADDQKKPVKLTLEGEDRSGLTSDITHLLNNNDVTVEHFESQRFPVVGLSTGVFEATLNLKLPKTLTLETLKKDIEALSDRMRVFLVES